MNKQTTKHIIVTGCSFVLGVFLLALCYNTFLGPNNFVVAGMTGIGIALEELCGINATMFIYITNILLLIISFILLGYEKTKNTIVGSILYPVMITFTAPFAKLILEYMPIDDNILIVLFAGLFYGVGNGLVYKCGYTTGGNDVLMQLLHKYLHIPESRGLTIVNLIVIGFGIMTFGYMKGIYALLILLTSTLFIDKIMFGIADSKIFYIFTKNAPEIKKIIVDEFHSGFTIYNTEGGFSKDKRTAIMCVVPNRYYYLLKQKILEVEPDAFFIIESCYEVNGGVVRNKLPFLD